MQDLSFTISSFTITRTGSPKRTVLTLSPKLRSELTHMSNRATLKWPEPGEQFNALSWSRADLAQVDRNPRDHVRGPG